MKMILMQFNCQMTRVEEIRIPNLMMIPNTLKINLNRLSKNG